MHGDDGADGGSKVRGNGTGSAHGTHGEVASDADESDGGLVDCNDVGHSTEGVCVAHVVDGGPVGGADNPAGSLARIGAVGAVGAAVLRVDEGGSPAVSDVNRAALVAADAAIGVRLALQVDGEKVRKLYDGVDLGRGVRTKQVQRVTNVVKVAVCQKNRCGVMRLNGLAKNADCGVNVHTRAALLVRENEPSMTNELYLHLMSLLHSKKKKTNSNHSFSQVSD